MSVPRGASWGTSAAERAQTLQFFQHHGYTVVRGFFPKARIASLSDELLYLHRTAEQREYCGETFGRISFIRTAHLWLRSPAVRSLAFDERLAELACDLLQIDGVRIIGDDIFYKPVNARVSSWHFDRDFVPIDREHFVSIWIPVTPASRSSGAMAYASGTHLRALPRPRWPFRHEVTSHLWYQAQTRLRGVNVDTVPADVGDVLIHHGRTLHKAHPNRSSSPRIAFGIHMVDARSRFVEPANRAQVMHVRECGWSSLKEGDEIEVPLAPVVYQR